MKSYEEYNEDLITALDEKAVKKVLINLWRLDAKYELCNTDEIKTYSFSAQEVAVRKMQAELKGVDPDIKSWAKQWLVANGYKAGIRGVNEKADSPSPLPPPSSSPSFLL